MEIVRWSDEPVEQLSAGIGRQMLNTVNMTVAMIHLDAGAVVPRHQHHNEQVANILSGSARFVVGDGDVVVVAAGESIVLPADTPHEVVALEDTIVIDVFAPRREDWISGDDSYLRR